MTNPPSADQTLNEARQRLFERLAALGIDASIVPYPAHETVEEGKALRGNMSGTFTKNLLLKDKKDRVFLIAIHEDRALDLKTLHLKVGANGRLGFASGVRMIELLGVIPGALTPLGLLNDTTNTVTAVLDASLLSSTQLNFHPLINTESIGLTPADLIAFIRSCGREPNIVDFDAPHDTPPNSKPAA